MCLDQQREHPRTKSQLAIILRNHERLIGNCGIRTQSPAALEAGIGYKLAPAYRGHSFATEAAQAILTFGFTELHVHRIWAQCIVDNVDSVRVLEKVGMRQEEHLRENTWMKGRWWDTLLYRILEDEWRVRR